MSANPEGSPDWQLLPIDILCLEIQLITHILSRDTTYSLTQSQIVESSLWRTKWTNMAKNHN